jgi:hypothetical protein
MEEERSIKIIFVREFKGFTSVCGRKGKEDYILNVNKIIKDKFKTKFITPNKIQSFLINYEIKKLLDKSINIKNKKYKKIVYLNSNLSIGVINNAIQFISDEYYPINFTYMLIESKEFEDDNLDSIKELEIIRI